MTGQVSESSTDPEATPKAKPSSLPPPSRVDSAEYAQELARFLCYSDAELPETLRNRQIHQRTTPSLFYGLLVPGGNPYIVRIAEELKLNTLPTNSSHPTADRSMTEYDARACLASYIMTRWPMTLFRDSRSFGYSPSWGCALDKDKAATGIFLVLYSNAFADQDYAMFHKSASIFQEVLGITKKILRLPKEAEPHWFYHPASSRSSEYKFDLHRCFYHDYPPVRNTSDSSV